jgi:hypothetical protein
VLSALVALAVLAGFAILGRWERTRNARIQNEQMAAVFMRATSDGLASHRLDRYRLGWTIDCLTYVPRREPTALGGLELCFDREGRLVETIDRLSGTPHFASLQEAPGLSTIRVPVPRLLATFERAAGGRDPRLRGLPTNVSRLPTQNYDNGAIDIPNR